MTPVRIFLSAACCLISAACVSASGGLGLNNALIKNGRPADAQAYSDFLIARFAAMTNDPDMAAEHYAAAIDSAPEKSGIADRAVFTSLLSGEYTEAVHVAERADRLGSEAALVRLTLGVDAIIDGRDAEARTILETTRFGPFNRMVARGLTAWDIAGARGTSAAINYLHGGLTGDPRLDSATLYMMGLMQMSAGEDEAALETFEALWESGARLAVGVEAHAQLLAHRGNRDRALLLINEFRTSVGDNASIDRLRTAIVAGKDIKVRRLKPQEGAALAVFVPASALMSQTSDDVSAVYFVLALALDPDLHIARSLWGQSLDNAGRRDEALAVLTRIPETSAFYATSRGQIAWALHRNERDEAALAVANEALKHSPDRGLKVQLADLYRALDRHAEAETLLSEVIATDSRAAREDWRLIYARGAAREELGRWPEAEADLNHALRLQPDDASLLNYLGYSYVDRGEHLDEALDMIQRAAELDPESGYIFDSLGWAYYRLGRYEMATRYLEQAVEIVPGNPVLNDHLGDAYWQVGRKLEARFQWERSLRLDPDASDRELIEVKLLSGPEEPVVRKAETGGPVQLPASQRP